MTAAPSSGAGRIVVGHDGSASSLAALSWAAYMSGDPVGGVARGEQALALNPNNVEAYRALGQNLVWLDRIRGIQRQPATASAVDLHLERCGGIGIVG